MGVTGEAGSGCGGWEQHDFQDFSRECGLALAEVPALRWPLPSSPCLSDLLYQGHFMPC